MIMENKTENQKQAVAAEKQQVNKGSFRGFVEKHPVLFTVLVALFVVLVVYFWKELEGRQERRAVVKAASLQLMESKQEMLVLFCKPLVWSVRSELLRRNLEQVDVLISDLVKEKNMESIHLVDPSGVLFLSTDKKLEGQPAGDGLDKNLLTTDSITVQMLDSFIVVAAPVMGYDRRLATLVFYYKADGFVVPD